MAGVRLAGSLALTACLAACGGEIVFGRDRSDGSTSSRDGASDGGVSPTIDAGPMDAGSVVDAGCLIVADTWPFPRDKATYKARFWDFANTQTPLNCNSPGTCHGGPMQKPLMPPADADLDDSTQLNTAIDELWATVKPSVVTANLPSMSYVHRPMAEGGKGAVPLYTGEQTSFVEAFLAMSTTSTACR